MTRFVGLGRLPAVSSFEEVDARRVRAQREEPTMPKGAEKPKKSNKPKLSTKEKQKKKKEKAASK